MAENTTESELESFRRQWKDEVSARTRRNGAATAPATTAPNRPLNETSKRKIPSVASSSQPPILPVESKSSYNPGAAYHDLEDKSEHLKLGNESVRRQVQAAAAREPQSALEHYEKAVERETLGNLGDSLKLYRKAFRLDSNVQDKYKAKHFPPAAPPSASKTPNANPSNAAVTVPNPAHHSLHGPSISELLDDFSALEIARAPPETDLSPAPPCPIATLPEELLSQVLADVGFVDVADVSRVALVCKRFAYLAMTEERIWKTAALNSKWGFGAMHYHYACTVKGKQLLDSPFDSPTESEQIPLYKDLTPSEYPTYRAQYRARPRIRFNGCYISTVNYTRPGQATQSQFTWTSPVHIVTYYRYLRFFRDGSVISLLTTAEPPDVVHHLTQANMPGGSSNHHYTGALPSAVMKDALPGRWRLSGGPNLRTNSSILGLDNHAGDDDKGPGEYVKEPLDEGEAEGDLHVETEGVVPKYMYKIQFGLASAGKREGTRNNKLVWKRYWNYNRLTDDWGEFGMKNDRPFYWSRVKSYYS